MIPKRILMVEDNELDRYILRRALKRTWPESELGEATDGLEAIELLDGSPDSLPDLILLDINMPRMGGLEFLETYYDDSGHAMPVVMMLTSSNREDDRDQALRHDCVLEYLVKPIKRETLERLPEALDRAA